MKDGHIWPWVVDSEIEASWIRLIVVFSFLLGRRTKVHTTVENVPLMTTLSRPISRALKTKGHAGHDLLVLVICVNINRGLFVYR